MEQLLMMLKKLGYKEVKEEEVRSDKTITIDKGQSCPGASNCPFVEECCKGKGKDEEKGDRCLPWTLGEYDPFRRVVILYVDRINKASYRIGCYVKDIVRIHEHIHAFTHQRLEDVYLNIPEYVNEAVTEFLTKYYILLFKIEYENCFNALSRSNPFTLQILISSILFPLITIFIIVL